MKDTAPLPEAVMSEYIKGFDAGCNYIVNAIKVVQRQYGNNVPLNTLIDHLTGTQKEPK